MTCACTRVIEWGAEGRFVGLWAPNSLFKNTFVVVSVVVNFHLSDTIDGCMMGLTYGGRVVSLDFRRPYGKPSNGVTA